MTKRLERCYTDLPLHSSPNNNDNNNSNNHNNGVQGQPSTSSYDHSMPPALPPKLASLPLPPTPAPPLPPPLSSPVVGSSSSLLLLQQQDPSSGTAGNGVNRLGLITSQTYGNNGICSEYANNKSSASSSPAITMTVTPSGTCCSSSSPVSSSGTPSPNHSHLDTGSNSSSGNWSSNNETAEEIIAPSSIVPSSAGAFLNNSNDNGACPKSQGTSLAGSTRSSHGLETKSSALLDSHDRFKPEKIQRRPVQKMKWNQTRWSRNSLAGDLFTCLPPTTIVALGGSVSNNGSCKPSFFNGSNGIHTTVTSGTYGMLGIPNPAPVESESRVSSMTIADVSPRLAVKKVLLLYEHAQYREAATFIHRLSIGTFRIILRELPLDIFIEAMPHSIPIMEALYTKVFTSDGPAVSLKALRPEAVVMHIVKFFSREEIVREMRNRRDSSSLGTFTTSCKKILRVIVIAESKMIKTLQHRRRALDKAVEGMGQHGLVGTTDESLLPLHDALKLEFRRVVDTYKGALQKLEDLALSAKSNPKSVAHGPAPIQASHQRQLSLRAEEIQDRLIKNKSLLNVVEPTLDNNCLDILLGILQRRIELDKESLFQFTQLRKEAGDITADSLVAPMLMRYSRGCKQVLEMMKEVLNEAGGIAENCDGDSSDLSGYHSDSDSAIMTSGNSPYVSPRARYNFISRSVRSKAILRPSIMFHPSVMPGSNGSTNRKADGSSSSSSGVSCIDSRSGSGFSSCCLDSPPPPPSNSGPSITPGGMGNSSSSVKTLSTFTLPSGDVGMCECNGTTSNKQKLPSTRGLPPSSYSATPIRPRHVKMKNQLHKNNSLGSTSSSGGSESSSTNASRVIQDDIIECNSNNNGTNNNMSMSMSNGNNSNNIQPSCIGCLDCVTLVSVPDNHVITQGVNHRCATAAAAAMNNMLAHHNNSNKDSSSNIEKDQIIGDLQSEINQLRRGLANANSTINHLQEREKKFILSAARSNLLENGNSHHGLQNNHHHIVNSNKSMLKLQPILNSMRDKEERRAQWIHEYGALYAKARVETMDALDALPYLTNADELKSKLLYSVVVLSFRAVQSHVSDLKNQLQGLLQMNQPLPTLSPVNSKYKLSLHQQTKKSMNLLLIAPLQSRVSECINDYLQYSGQLFELDKYINQVANQLWTTLYDYPRLRNCEGLMNYIRAAVNLAWGLSNQTPPCVLEYETKVFMREMHVRFHSSDQSSEIIKAYLWPALLEGKNGPCIHKGVVVT